MQPARHVRRAAVAAFAAAVLALTAETAAAQRATGIVTDRTTLQPVSLAVVALIDSAGAVLQQVLTSSEGAFVMNVPTGATLRLRVERIGYQTLDSESFRFDSPADRAFTLRIDARPIPIAGIQATGEQTCAINSSAGEVLRVWTEARKALAASAIAERERVFSFSGYTYTRDVDANGVVLQQDRQPYSARSSQPFTGMPAEFLVIKGYVVADDDGVAYYAPSADVLLSPEFERVNCFSLRSSRAEPDLIGVSFAPNRRLRLPSVAGTVWLDSRTMQLHYVEFGYVNVSSIPFAEHASGRVDFRMLPNGGWLVSRWLIRMPASLRLRRARDRSAASVVVWTEDGGELQTAVMGGRRFAIGEADAAAGVLAVSVFDSTTARPLEGAVVVLGDTPLAGRTAADGTFSVAAVPAGRYAVTFRHPRLDSLPAYRTEPPVVDVHAGRTVEVELAVPPLARSALAECEARPGRTAVFGMVRDAVSGEPLPQAQIELTWDSVVVTAIMIGSAPRGRSIRPSSDGRYISCDMPVDQRIDATVEIEGSVLLRAEFRIDTSPKHQPFDVPGVPRAVPAGARHFHPSP